MLSLSPRFAGGRRYRGLCAVSICVCVCVCVCVRVCVRALLTSNVGGGGGNFVIKTKLKTEFQNFFSASDSPQIMFMRAKIP